MKWIEIGEIFESNEGQIYRIAPKNCLPAANSFLLKNWKETNPRENLKDN